jgi:hypothetical protein
LEQAFQKQKEADLADQKMKEKAKLELEKAEEDNFIAVYQRSLKREDFQKLQAEEFAKNFKAFKTSVFQPKWPKKAKKLQPEEAISDSAVDDGQNVTNNQNKNHQSGKN